MTLITSSDLRATGHDEPALALAEGSAKATKERTYVNSTAPLIVDLDGSLLRTDTLHELIAAALPYPQVLARAFWQFLKRGRAGLKRHLAENVPIDVRLLPVNENVLSFVRSERSRGRVIYLVTGADSAIADGMTKRFAEFEGSFASDGHTNLTSHNKAALLVREFGTGGFDYIGNTAADHAVWREADRSYLASARPARVLPRWAREAEFAEVFRENADAAWRIWLKELRVHQSVKNLLIFLPILAAHAFDARAILLLIAGFISFVFMSSSVYLLNDLLDLKSDRLHEWKSQRPIAAGRILPLHALAASALLAFVSLALAITVSAGFTFVLIAYATLTCLYSFWIKRLTLVDVIVLAMLYMIRIVAGAVIADIQLSFWFTGVALFLFISLALVKRYTELSRIVSADSDHSLPGRGYNRADVAVMLPLGVGTGLAALLLMAIYLQSDAVALLYPSAVVLWLVIPAMFYWLANMWVKAGRGAMHDDPIVFALRNPASLVSGAVVAVLFIAASTPIAALAKDLISGMG